MTTDELDDRLAELLIGAGHLTDTMLERARSFQATRRSTLGGALLDLRLVPEDLLRSLLEEITGARAFDPSLMSVNPDFVERMSALIPPEAVTALFVFPVQMETNRIHVCMLNPTDGWVVRALEALSGCRVAAMVSSENALATAINRHYAGQSGGTVRYQPVDGRAVAESIYRKWLTEPFDNYAKPAISLVNRTRDAVARDPKALESVLRDPVVIRLVQQIICRAIEAGASDVHIEATGEALRIRQRIDGSMRVFATLPPAMAIPLVARLKAMAELPVARATTPLDGHIGYDLTWGRGVDLRFSLVPAVTGERVVLRVLDRARDRWKLSDLGMDEAGTSEVEAAIGLPNGLMLVTGPTGSGKSSTLYAILDRLNADDVCILTAEDPVESKLAGIAQVQCDEASGLTFGAALRSFLRQDPDSLMVGEIRDAETADIALKAALTGHLVLSTLHTNDAPGAVLRLLNMGLEPFVVASALRLVVAQRLLRRLCPACRVPVSPSPEVFRRVVAGAPARLGQLLEGGTVFEAKGCAACGGSGYRGRTGIFEVLRITERIEELIISRATAAAIRAQARAEGMRTLREAGLCKVAAGETSIDEVLQQTAPESDQQQRVLQ